MKNWIVFIFLLFHLCSIAQSGDLIFADTELQKFNEKYTDVTLGYVFQSPNQGFKASISVNNILFHRFGFYSSIESNSAILHNTIGVTATINSWGYLYGGVDLLSQNGLLRSKKFTYRKEAGVGITPYKWIVIRAGYSLTVGPTLSAGVKIPLEGLIF